MTLPSQLESDSEAGPPPSEADRRPTILAVREVSRIYRMGEVTVPAVRRATLDLFRGEFLVVVGPSGSGKSTLLNLLGGMDRPTSGRIQFGDADLAQASDAELTRYRRRCVGFVFQFYNLVPTLTALENVQVATELVEGPVDPMEALKLVDLAERADHFPSQLSGGEQQRVSLARALAKRPQLMLCDEPTGALDITTGKQVLGLMVRIKRELGQTIVLITHNSALTRIGDRVATIRDGVVESVVANRHPLAPEEIAW